MLQESNPHWILHMTHRLLFWITGFELAELLTKGTYLPHCQSSALNKPLLFSAICLPISVPLFFTLSTAFPFSIP
jgi:hypothetical protein